MNGGTEGQKREGRARGDEERGRKEAKGEEERWMQIRGVERRT